MPMLTFLPFDTKIEVEENTKILAAARRDKVPIRFGCGVGRCGTCAVHVKEKQVNSRMTPLQTLEIDKLEKMGLATDGSIRLACQARIIEGSIEVDLDFQNSYDPGLSK